MEQEQKKSRKKILPILLMLIVIAGIGYGIKEYLYSLHHEDTDDAQVDGDISPVNARVAGYVNDIFFRDNQAVKKGDTLVKIDDRDLRLKQEQAQAAFENAVATVAVAKANILSAQANVASAKTSVDNAKIKVWKATQDYNRYQNLLSDKSITQSQFDAVKADKESSEAQLDLAKRQWDASTALVSAAQQQIPVAEAQVKAKQVDIDFAKLQLSYAVITSPATGIASKKNIQLGQLVQAGQTLFAVVTDTNNYIVANFKETQLTDMKEGQKVKVHVDAFSKNEIEGTVYSLSAATGAKFSLLPPDNSTGNFVKVVQRVPVKIKLNVPAELANRLRPGMSARVSVSLD